MEIIPAILTGDPVEARQVIEQVRDGGRFSRVQVDFVDGLYNNNLTFMPGDLLVSEFPELEFDAHLMVVEGNIREWSNEAEVAGYGRIIAQLESISHPEELRGLAMDVHSPVAAIEPYLSNLEVAVVMAVEPGFGGQDFLNMAIEHVKKLVSIREQSGYKFRICVDGGVEEIHLSYLEKWGTDEVAVGAKRVLDM